MSENFYYDLYNNLPTEKFNEFIDTFLSKEKVCLKLSLLDSTKMEELKIDPAEPDKIIFDLKITCLFENSILTKNLELVKFINEKYDAINKWKNLPERYLSVCFDPVFIATKFGYIDVLRYLSANGAIEKKYFEDEVMTAKLIQIACLINHGYSQDQIINFLETIYNLNDNVVIFIKNKFYNFTYIKRMVIEEIKLQIEIKYDMSECPN